jgi:putative CocE/NonD family hydrolase
LRLVLRLLFFVVGLYLVLSFRLKYRLGRPSHRVRHTARISVAMPDGVALSTDVFQPIGDGPHPTLLMRLPYGRAGFAGIAHTYAAHGFNVVLQACRGTEESAGVFNPLTNERADGLATLGWLRLQPWFDGRLGLTGPSYLGFTAWAIADAPEVKAIAIKVSSSEFRSVVFPAGAFHLGLWLSWLQVIEGLGDVLIFSLRMLTGDIERRTARAALTLPLLDADRAAVGRPVPFWRDWFATAIEDGPFWHAMDHRTRAAETVAPVHLLGGWYDFMIDALLADYRRLADAGRAPWLTVSVSTHIGGGHDVDNPVETLAWMRRHLLGDTPPPQRKPVAIEISGLGKWCEFDTFPPDRPTPVTRYLLPAGTLADHPPSVAAPPSRYTYDPADPTPNRGGAIFAFTGAGPVSQRSLERRPDTLCFTSESLISPLTLIGNATATLFMRARVPHADLFVRLSDVDRYGRSRNICDGFRRIAPETPRDPDGILRLEIRLHATAHSFRRGHRLRIVVASGAHPRYARNFGTDDPIATATRLVANDIEIFHDPVHPAAITLPCYEVEGR